MTPFDRTGKRSLLKTLWEKNSLLVQAISPFPTMFSTLSKTEIIIFVTFNLSSANAFNLVCSKILLCGNGLKNPYLFTKQQHFGHDQISWLVVYGFNATLTAKVISHDPHVFSGFLTPVLTQLSFQSHRLLFSHTSAAVRGQNMPERQFASTGLELTTTRSRV